MAPYTMLMLAGLVASVAGTPLKQASRSDVVAQIKRGPLRRDQPSNMPKPNIPTPQCAGLGNFYIASIDPAGNFGYVTQNGEQALASVAPEQKYAVLYTVDSSCRLSSVSAPGGVAGSDDQLFDYTILPTADEPIPRFDVASRIPSGGAAITCTTGGRDGFGNYFTCYNPFTGTKDVCIGKDYDILYFSDMAPADCTKVQLYYSDPQ